MPARARRSGPIESVNPLHSALKRVRRCLNRMSRVPGGLPRHSGQTIQSYGHSLLKPVVMGGIASRPESAKDERVLANSLRAVTVQAASKTQGLRMTRKDLMATYGRAGLAIAAFALVAGIIAAPVLPKLGPSPVVASKPQDEPTLRSLIAPANLTTN